MSPARSSLSLPANQQFPHHADFLLDSVHLLIVPRPHLAPLHGLPLGHLSSSDNLVHEIPENPNANKADWNNKDDQGAETWNTEEHLKLIARRDDEEGKIDYDKEGLTQIESILLGKEKLSPTS